MIPSLEHSLPNSVPCCGVALASTKTVVLRTTFRISDLARRVSASDQLIDLLLCILELDTTSTKQWSWCNAAWIIRIC
jgi:hypothetical protein